MARTRRFLIALGAFATLLMASSSSANADQAECEFCVPGGCPADLVEYCNTHCEAEEIDPDFPAADCKTQPNCGFPDAALACFGFI